MEICTGTCIFTLINFPRIRPYVGFEIMITALAIVYYFDQFPPEFDTWWSLNSVLCILLSSVFPECDPWWGLNSRSLSHKAEALTILPGRTDKMLATDTTCNY